MTSAATERSGPAPGGQLEALEAQVRDLARKLTEVSQRMGWLEGVGGPAGPSGGPGFGAGEWLALLQDAGVPATGVDANPAFVEAGRARDLDLAHGDAVAHLQGLPPDSVDLVTAFHGIEHLDVKRLLELLAAARHALRPGGCVPLETPNSGNLRQAANGSYHEPTHRSHLVSVSGSEEVQVGPLHPNQPGASAGQQVEQLLSVTRYGPQDYAVLGYQPQPAERA